MSINIFSENVPSFDNEIKYTTKVQNDIEYVNTTGDILTGDLNLNENKIILKDSKAEIQHAQGDDFDGTVFRNSCGFAFTDFDNNTLFSVTTNIFANNKRIVSLGNPVANKDATTKEYVDSKQSETKTYVDSKISTPNFDNLTVRYLKYSYIKNNFKPTFWVSGFFNQGVKVMDNTTLVNSTAIKEITGSDSVNRGTFTFTKEDDDNISLRLDGSNKITSNVKYQNFYTFILIMSKDLNSIGRLFNNSTENQLFGFWSNQVGSIWLNDDVKINHKINDGKRKFMILRNNDDSKDAWLNGEQYVTNAGQGDRNWGHYVSVGTNVFNENAKGKMYEVICFNKALSNDDIEIITDRLKEYYPFT